ncbi:MAG: ABC transporter substrate-binding protein [Thermoplasmata archaeon]|nr:ABC transporter substrate-binding protein [Thermoplasmata archaeon]
MEKTLAKKEFVIWTALLVAVSSVLAFTGGYMVSAVLTEDEAGILLVDDYGRTIKLDKIPERIVSAAPTPTEILFAVGAGDLVVGVDDYSDYPAEVSNITKVGSYTLSTEVIISLQPDLVVSSDLVPISQLELLEDRGIPFVVLATRTLDDVLKDIRLVGILTGHVEEANDLADSLEERIDAVTEKTMAEDVVKPRVYLEYYPYWTYGPGSFGNDLIALAGGMNIAENTTSEYPMLSSEFIIAQDPEIIVYTIGYMTTTTAEEISSRSGWSGITAVVSGDIYSMDDNLVSRYGPRIVDGLEELASLLHPDLFA